ncbi:MAG: hypothetical protein RR540_03085, partial [Oscillospiraceae bacterium]
MDNHIQDAAKILSDNNFDHLDLVVISHQDNDHWRNFLEFINFLTPHLLPLSEWLKKEKTEMFRHQNKESDLFEFNPNFLIYSKYLDLSEKFPNKHPVAEISIKCPNTEEIGLLSLTINLQCFDAVFNFTARYSRQTSTYSIALTYHCGSKRRISGKSTFDDIFEKFCELLLELSNNPDFDCEKCSFIKQLLVEVCITFKTMWGEFPDLSKIDLSTLTPYFPIKKLILGGADCGKAYNLFKRNCKIFAKSVLEPNTSIFLYNELRRLHYTSIVLEENISTPRLGKSGAIYKNASSVIIAFQPTAENCVLLFPGDATVHTFASLTDILENSGLSIELLIAPHHGSDDTNFAYGADKNIMPKEEQPFCKLLSSSEPSLIFISANKSKYGHPGDIFLEYSKEAVLQTFGYCLTTENDCLDTALICYYPINPS